MPLTATPLTSLSEGIMAALNVPAVTALATGGVTNALPDDPSYPIVRVTARGKPVGPIAGHSIWECEAEVDIYTDYAGDQEALAIADAIATVLNQQALTADGWTVLLSSLLDLYRVPDEFINGLSVNRWTLPFLVRMARA